VRRGEGDRDRSYALIRGLWREPGLDKAAAWCARCSAAAGPVLAAAADGHDHHRITATIITAMITP